MLVEMCDRTKKRPCSDDSCTFCAEHSLAGCERAVRRWADTSSTPRQVWRTSWKKIRLCCDECGRVYEQPAARIEKHDCALCANKSERALYEFMKANGHDVAYQVSFAWAGKARYDFLVDGRIIVELDGPQHFRPIQSWKSGFEVCHSDLEKETLALKHGYPMMRVLQADMVAQNPPIDWKQYVRTALEEAAALGSVRIITPHRREYTGGVYARLRTDTFFF